MMANLPVRDRAKTVAAVVQIVLTERLLRA